MTEEKPDEGQVNLDQEKLGVRTRNDLKKVAHKEQYIGQVGLGKCKFGLGQVQSKQLVKFLEDEMQNMMVVRLDQDRFGLKAFQ